MKYLFLLLFFLSMNFANMNANPDSTTIYLIPGQGADHRLFNNLELDTNYKIKHIHYSVPEKGISLKNYAQTLSKQINRNGKYILIGVSLGGMIATEMSQFLNPEKVIIISSAKNRNELPLQYKLQKKIPLYKLVSPNMAKLGAKIMQPIVEPDRRHEKETFKNMLNDKDPDFLKRTIEMILNWDRTITPENIIHIHGNKDHTIPIKNLNYDYLIPKGSHMMTLTRGKEISKLINQLLKK